MNIALVIATCDRPGDIRKLLDSLNTQTLPLHQIVIVDGGTESVESVVREFPALRIDYMKSPVRSASYQRNMGIRAVDHAAELLGFADDDVVFEKEAFETMGRFWTDSSERPGGMQFNYLNHPDCEFRFLKNLPLTEKLGLYSMRSGAVLVSGIQTMIGRVPEDLRVDWISSGASLWRREIFDVFQFDEWFGGYSYLEDLDFSYAVGKKYGLYVVAAAGFNHYPAQRGRGSGAVFGKREVLNRLHFVRKHEELSPRKCYLALSFRALMSLFNGLRRARAYDFARFWGNILGFWESLLS